MVRPGLPKMIATDLDGTLVRSDETVSDYTHQVFGRARAQGIRIVGVTGRGPRLTALSLRDLPSAHCLVMAGGGHVVDLADPRNPTPMADTRLPGSVLADILRTLERETGPLSVLVEAHDHHNAPLLGDPDPAWRYPDLVEPRPRSQALAGPVIKGFARHPHHDADTLLAIAQRLVPPSTASITQAGLGYIEICAPGVTKAAGLAAVAGFLGVDRSDILAFGDMPNDLPMLDYAGFGAIAVGNAHPSVQHRADTVVGTNDSDGVARYLDQLLTA